MVALRHCERGVLCYLCHPVLRSVGHKQLNHAETAAAERALLVSYVRQLHAVPHELHSGAIAVHFCDSPARARFRASVLLAPPPRQQQQRPSVAKLCIPAAELRGF